MDQDIIEAETTEQTESTPQVIKSTSKAWFFSCLALLATGYLYYLHFFQPKPETEPNQPNPKTQAEINQLRTKLSDTETLLNQLQQQISKVEQQSTQNQAAQQRQPDEPQVTQQPFDNSANETALNELRASLSQLQTEVQTLEQNDRTVNSLNPVTPTVNPSVIQAINGLTMSQALLSQHQLQPALKVLQNLSSLPNLGAQNQLALQRIINDLSQLPAVDQTVLTAGLATARQGVQALALPTSADVQKEEKPWYKNFIQVKKINPETNLQSTIELNLLKATLMQQLLQAEMALTLKDQTGWEQQLNAARTQLASTQIPTANLNDTLQNLASLSVHVKIPEGLGISELINQLEQSSHD